MKDEIKEINIKIPGQILDYVDTKEHLLELFGYITNLQEKYDKALELLADFNMPCEYDEGKIPDNYCEEKCDVGDEIYKKCWDKYIELTLRGKSDE